MKLPYARNPLGMGNLCGNVASGNKNSPPPLSKCKKKKKTAVHSGTACVRLCRLRHPEGGYRALRHVVTYINSLHTADACQLK